MCLVTSVCFPSVPLSRLCTHTRYHANAVWVLAGWRRNRIHSEFSPRVLSFRQFFRYVWCLFFLCRCEESEKNLHCDVQIGHCIWITPSTVAVIPTDMTVWTGQNWEQVTEGLSTLQTHVHEQQQGPWLVLFLVDELSLDLHSVHKFNYFYLNNRVFWVLLYDLCLTHYKSWKLSSYRLET